MTDANESIQIVVKKTYTISKEKAKSIPLIKNLIEDDMYENKTLELPRGYDVFEHVLNSKELIVEDDKRLEELKQEFSYFGLETDKLVDDFTEKMKLMELVDSKILPISDSFIRKTSLSALVKIMDMVHRYKFCKGELDKIKKQIRNRSKERRRKYSKSPKRKSWNSIQPRN